MTCITCHDPHRPTEAQKVQAACMKCHTAKDCKEQPKIPNAVQGDCVSCHMPRTNRMPVLFHHEDDQYLMPLRPHRHRIAVYPEAKDEVLWNHFKGTGTDESQREAQRIADKLVARWLDEANAMKAQFRFTAEISACREAERFDRGQSAKTRLKEAVNRRTMIDSDYYESLRLAEERKIPEAITFLEKVLKAHPTHAAAHAKIGSLFAQINGVKDEKAKFHLHEVSKHDPDNASGFNMLGWLAYLDGRFNEAADFFKKADEILPYSQEINYRWGLALMGSQTWREAIDRFEYTLKINPQHVGAHQGISHSLREQGNYVDAVRHARRAVKLSAEQNVDVLITLIDAYQAAKRNKDADETIQKALNLAQRTSPNLIPIIQERKLAR